MISFGELQQNPKKIKDLNGDHVLIAASEGSEVVVQKARSEPEATVVFMHETIAMMRAERAEQLDKLKAQLAGQALVVPIRKKPESFWDYITVGRAASSDIVLEDPAASNMHAHFALDVEDHAVSVQDVGSSNGTFINRERLQPHTLVALRSGDCVRFGQTIFYYLHHSTLREILGVGG